MTYNTINLNKLKYLLKDISNSYQDKYYYEQNKGFTFPAICNNVMTKIIKNKEYS